MASRTNERFNMAGTMNPVIHHRHIYFSVMREKGVSPLAAGCDKMCMDEWNKQ